MLTALWRKLFSTKLATKRKHTRRNCRPRIEMLEDRCVPTTFKVSATTGADGSDGVVNPFRSIQHAINAAQSGDTILMAAGTYGFNAAEDRFSATGGTTAVAFVI